MPPLSSLIRQHNIRVKPAGPLWLGPSAPGWNGGVTQSMLQGFLQCRERFRIRYVLGLRPREGFNHRIGYGDMWHVCEEAHASTDGTNWTRSLLDHARDVSEQYPMDREKIAHWYNVCLVQFPHYVNWWSTHRDVKNRTPLLSEQVFDVPYSLPSGRVVRLRGKWDSVDLVTNGKKKEVWLQENKSKGDVDMQAIPRQLRFDLQTMTYLIALQEYPLAEILESRNIHPSGLLGGVRFNVIRRPMSGGQGSIVQGKGTKGAKCPTCKGGTKLPKKLDNGKCWKCRGAGRLGAKPAETGEAFYARLNALIAGATGPEWGVGQDEHYFFHRWNVEVSPKDIEVFKQQFLHPVLEQLCWWYDVVVLRKDQDRVAGNYGYPETHFRAPFGVHYSLDDDGTSEYDSYLENGNSVGLVRQNELFGELK